MPVERTSHLVDDPEWLAEMKVTARIQLSDDTLILTPGPQPSAPAWAPGPPALLKVTSGTTARPRAVRFTAAALWHDGDQILHDMQITSADRQLAVISFCHSYGFGSLILPLLIAGVPVVLASNPLPAVLANACQRGAATVFPGVPVMFRALATADSVVSLAPLRLCISAGAPLPPTTTLAFREKFGVPIQVFYGASECGGIAFDPRPESGAIAGLVGRPMRHVRIDFEQTPGPSLVRISGPTVGEGYYPARSEDVAVLAGGSFRISDLVELRPEGLALAGRVDDLLEIGGRKVNPVEIEQALTSSGAAREAVVFGYRPGEGTTRIVAAIVGAHDSDLQLRARCATRLASWMVPDRFWRLEQIPVSGRGKISRRDLATRYPG